MYICYLLEIENDNRKSSSPKFKLPVIPRLGDYINLSVIKEEKTLTLAGIVKSVDMYCSIEESNSEFYQDGIPEPKELTWYITIEQEKTQKRLEN